MTYALATSKVANELSEVSATGMFAIAHAAITFSDS